ncbi:Nucleoside phosphorylase domain [Cinara cedri]|uniref:Nucleoside phosphorylase domain n=1 Tax=Cinara cedri TaxID=506608 RepID=A0A5E4MRM4_9HEMI|nr:Nucleoside phosphorylase domain [Cinara cedri]
MVSPPPQSVTRFAIDSQHLLRVGVDPVDKCVSLVRVAHSQAHLLYACPLTSAAVRKKLGRRTEIAPEKRRNATLRWTPKSHFKTGDVRFKYVFTIMTNQEERVVLITKSKSVTSTVLVVERQVDNNNDRNEKNEYIAGGEHSGIVISKIGNYDVENETPADTSVQFCVFLVNGQTGLHTKEMRTIRFWCNRDEKVDASAVASQFFQDLVSPDQFPLDYVGFVKRMLTLMHKGYKCLSRLEIELKQLEKTSIKPVHQVPVESSTTNSDITRTKLRELIESSYPNPLTIDDIYKKRGWDHADIKDNLDILQQSGIVKPVDGGGYTRVVLHDKIVEQIPIIQTNRQPTVAIITAEYCEKVAVDALIENKETFVRYTTVGESNVYTIGKMGNHSVVCTKLPALGLSRQATIASGNAITRLLGTFQKVEHVFVCGAGGGVPHYTNYDKHVKLGDVVVSHYGNKQKAVYTYCENVLNENGNITFHCRQYSPKTFDIQIAAMKLQTEVKSIDNTRPLWDVYLSEGLNKIEKQKTDGESDFNRPPADSDKLQMFIGGGTELIEITHPISDSQKNKDLGTRIHVGPIGGGQSAVSNESTRKKFATEYKLLAMDSEFDSVMGSLMGNYCHSYAVVRGISDYKDGSLKNDWQPYASLAAASVIKAILSIIKI